MLVTHFRPDVAHVALNADGDLVVTALTAGEAVSVVERDGTDGGGQPVRRKHVHQINVSSPAAAETAEVQSRTAPRT